MISRFARNFAALQILAFIVLLIWRPGHSLMPALAFWAGIAATILIDKVSSARVPQLEVLHVPPEAEDFERGIIGMVGTEETFARSITGLAHGVLSPGPEKVLFAAIKHSDGRIFAVSRPGRHGHVQQLMEMLNSCTMDDCGPERQGFITSLGSWLPREEALVVAQKNEQIVHKHPSDRELYSEDMWDAV
jgi:hypothetical protein